MRIGIDASRTFVNNPTGTERYAYEVTTRLLRLPQAREHEWMIYTRNPLLSLWEGFGESYVKIVNIPLKYLWTQVGLAARTWMDRLDVLWVPAHTLPILRQPSWLRSGKPLRTVVTIHGIEYEWLPAFENPLQRWYLPLSTLYATRTASKVISVSRFTKEELMKRMGVEEGKIEVIHEGVSKSRQGGRRALERWGLASGRYLLFVGTVQPRKNLEKLIEAFNGLSKKPRGKELKLVLAGMLGWGYEKVAEMAKNSAGKVMLTGYVDDREREELLRNALVYVQPSITEGFGLPVLEAMMVGVPVVSSDGGALREVVGDAGLLFNPFNVLEMTKQIESVINNYSLRRKLIGKGTKRAGDFSWERAAKETYKLLTCR